MVRSSNRLIFCKDLRHPRILSRGKATAVRVEPQFVFLVRQTRRHYRTRDGSDSAKDIASDQYQIAHQENHESAVDMRH